jgi:hypothetical protein
MNLVAHELLDKHSLLSIGKEALRCFSDPTATIFVDFCPKGRKEQHNSQPQPTLELS